MLRRCLDMESATERLNLILRSEVGKAVIGNRILQVFSQSWGDRCWDS